MIVKSGITTLSPAEQQAYALMDAAFMEMLRLMVQSGIHPERMVEPMAQKLAALLATVKLRGTPINIDAIADKLKTEYRESIKQVIGNGSLPQ